MSEQDLATQLTADLATLKTEITDAADRVIAKLNQLPTTGDVSPVLQAAINEIADDVAKLKLIAPVDVAKLNLIAPADVPPAV